MLDSFADIERALTAYLLNDQKGFCITAPMGHKIEVAKKIPAGPRRSKEIKIRADLELTKLAELLPLRADMVHSRMVLAITAASKFVAIFRNTKDVTSDHPEALVFSSEELQKFVTSVVSLEKGLITALTAENPQPKPKA